MTLTTMTLVMLAITHESVATMGAISRTDCTWIASDVGCTHANRIFEEFLLLSSARDPRPTPAEVEKETAKCWLERVVNDAPSRPPPACRGTPVARVATAEESVT